MAPCTLHGLAATFAACRLTTHAAAAKKNHAPHTPGATDLSRAKDCVIATVLAVAAQRPCMAGHGEGSNERNSPPADGCCFPAAVPGDADAVRTITAAPSCSAATTPCALAARQHCKAVVLAPVSQCMMGLSGGARISSRLSASYAASSTSPTTALQRRRSAKGRSGAQGCWPSAGMQAATTSVCTSSNSWQLASGGYIC
jgi:hypothetical protein